MTKIKEPLYIAYLETKIGIMEIKADIKRILEVSFIKDPTFEIPVPQEKIAPQPKHVKACINQLKEYFRGKRKEFDLPLAIIGRAFPLKVLKILRTVPYGQTRTYQELAAAAGKPMAYRAVGRINASNPIVVIVPCHRIIGSNGSLTGYGGGLWRKQWLLDHEQRHA